MTARIGSGHEPAEQWQICRHCRSMLYYRQLSRELNICPECGGHGPMSAQERLASLLDADSIQHIHFDPQIEDVLGFVDQRPYMERLNEARASTGMVEAVLCARGTIEGEPLIVAIMDFRFMGGSLGTAVGEAVATTADIALSDAIPLLLVTASGGARMQEGALSLMQLAKTSQALGQLDEHGLLTISLITDPTFGGVAASFATLADVIVAEPGARLGFAGPRVIEQTIKETLPEGFQTAEFLSDHGVVDVICPRPRLRATLGRLLRCSGPRGGSPSVGQLPQLITEPGSLPANDPWNSVVMVRDVARPTALDYIGGIAEDWTELHGDRVSSDCPAVVAGIGRIDGLVSVVVGTQKAHEASGLVARNFGMPSPGGYRKANRVMRLAGKLRLPVLTLVDTAGAYPGVEAEEQGQAVAIAENLRLMAALPVPIIAVVTGEGGSGGALALAVADRVIILSNAVYSVISPEGCAAILWKDRAAGPTAARALKVGAADLLASGVVDAVIPEPEGGAQADSHNATTRLYDAVRYSFRELLALAPDERVARRRNRYRSFGRDALSLAVPTIDHDSGEDIAPLEEGTA